MKSASGAGSASPIVVAVGTTSRSASKPSDPGRRPAELPTDPREPRHANNVRPLVGTRPPTRVGEASFDRRTCRLTDLPRIAGVQQAVQVAVPLCPGVLELPGHELVVGRALDVAEDADRERARRAVGEPR